MKRMIKQSPRHNIFKFGGEIVVSSLYILNVPIVISGSLANLSFDVVNTALPLLLGMHTMKEWSLVISTYDDTAKITINGEKNIC